MARQVLDHGVIIPAEYSDDWFEDMSTNLNKLNEVIGSDEDKLSEADVSEVALSGDYDDLTNKPALKPVATSGDYDDLTNKPSYGVLRMTSETLSNSGSGAISNLNSDSKLAAGDYVLDAALKVFPITAVSAPSYTVGTSLFQITNASALAAVATSGSYDDLNNLPTYGITRFVNAAITDNSNVAFANISSVDKIKAGDFLLDNAGKMYLIASVDTVNETAAVTTPLTQLAVDSGVMHLSGDETVAGIKTFSDIPIFATFEGIRFRCAHNSNAYVTFRNVGQADAGSIILSANDGTTGTSVHLVNKTFVPYNNNDTDLGSGSKSWKDSYAYHGYFKGQQQGDEYSGNARTNLTLTSNRDTLGQSGCVVDTFRENTAQGTGSHILGIGIKENSVRYEGCRFSWFYDDDNNGYVFSLRPTKQGTNQPIKYELGNSLSKWSTFNGINPGALSFPDFSNGIDISGYITTGSIDNSYTPPTNGWIWIKLIGSNNSGASIIQGDWGINARTITSNITNERLIETNLAVSKDIPVIIRCVLVTDVVSAKFYPCLGNV